MTLTTKQPSSVSVKETLYGQLPDGREVKAFTLQSSSIKATVINYGVTLIEFHTPDAQGNMGNIVQGYDNLEAYLDSTTYAGATVGRFSNRIANGRFSIGDKTYQLAQNGGPNNLHGGEEGFSFKLWEAQTFESENKDAGVIFTLLSEDGDQGFPGNLQVEVRYTLTREGVLKKSCRATSDQTTPVNMTHHSYFNLAGRGDILGHQLQVNADLFTPLNEQQVPTGEILSLDNHPLDFRTLTPIGQNIDADNSQIKIGAGFDHNYVIRKTSVQTLALAATLIDPDSQRALNVFTTAPGLQVYSSNFLDGSTQGHGQVHTRRSAVCLEPQDFPDAPNQAHFPSCFISPGQCYQHDIEFHPTVAE